MSAVVQGAQGVVAGVVGTVVKFPLWWYSRGLVHALTWVKNSVAGYARSVALGVWVKNMFVPMFGRHDWQSRLISVFMRVVNIIGRGLAVMVWAVLACTLFLVYIALPPVAAYVIVFHLMGSVFSV